MKKLRPQYGGYFFKVISYLVSESSQSLNSCMLFNLPVLSILSAPVFLQFILRVSLPSLYSKIFFITNTLNPHPLILCFIIFSVSTLWLPKALLEKITYSKNFALKNAVSNFTWTWILTVKQGFSCACSHFPSFVIMRIHK